MTETSFQSQSLDVQAAALRINTLRLHRFLEVIWTPEGARYRNWEEVPETERLAWRQAVVSANAFTAYLANERNSATIKLDESLFQQRAAAWFRACFTSILSFDIYERADRALEEMLELAQVMYSLGKSKNTTPDLSPEEVNDRGRARAHKLVDYVFSRPVGQLDQELGGVMVTTACLAEVMKTDMLKVANAELLRCWSKIDVIREKQAKKAAVMADSPLPSAE